MFRRLTTRRLIIATSFTAAVVTCFTPLPVGTSPPGSPGTDPYGGSVIFGNGAEALGLPTIVLLAGWVLVIGATLLRPRSRPITVAAATLALTLSIGSVLAGGRGYWLALTGFDTPQVGEAIYHLWRFSAAALSATAAGVLVLGRLLTPAPAAVIGPMATGFVFATVGLMSIPWGPSLSKVPAPVIAGGYVIAIGSIAWAAAQLWRPGIRLRSLSWRRAVALLVTIAGVLVAGRSLVETVAAILTGSSPASGLSAGLLFLGLSLTVMAALNEIRDASTPATPSPLLS